jgi:hypothetical protein
MVSRRVSVVRTGLTPYKSTCASGSDAASQRGHKSDTLTRPPAVTSGAEPFDESVTFAGEVVVRRDRACLLIALLRLPYKQEVAGSNPAPPTAAFHSCS